MEKSVVFNKRLIQHNSAHFGDSFSVKGIPWTSFLVIENLTSEQALQIEKHIKSMKSANYIRNLKFVSRDDGKLTY